MAAEPQQVLVLYNEPAAGAAPSEAGVLAEVAAVQAALEASGIAHRVAGVRTLPEALATVAVGGEAVVFNLVEGFAGGAAEEAVDVPAMCAALARGCTGNSTPCLALTLDKARTKGVLREHGIPVADGVVVRPGEPLPDLVPDAGPWIVKPVAADASEGIDAERSVVASPGPALAAAVTRIHRELDQAALVERLVGRRELNVSLLERGGAVEVLPIAEIDFSAFPDGAPRVVDYAAKWLAGAFAFHHTPRLLPAPLPEATARRVRELARGAWHAVGCTDYARVDLRLADDGRLYVLEVNANPDVAPDAGFAAALAAAAIPYAEFVRTVVDNARARRAPAASPPPLPEAEVGEGVVVRPLCPADREEVLALVRGAAVFRPEEQEIAREVLDDTLEHGTAAGYYGLVATVDGRVVGWADYGPIPCSVAAYDLYWVVVNREVRRRGIATALLARVEAEVARCGARLVAIETSGRPAYAAARSLYLRCGYREVARVAELYAPGDDKVIFAKRLAATP
jgi:D-alanine-D-alanine ligase